MCTRRYFTMTVLLLSARSVRANIIDTAVYSSLPMMEMLLAETIYFLNFLHNLSQPVQKIVCFA